jgi:heavy metal sensor kinase
MKLPNKLHVRLVLWTVALEAVLLLVFSVVLVATLQSTRSQQLDDTLRLSAAQMNAVIDVRNDQYTIPPEDTTALRTRGVLVWILSLEGQVSATVGQAADYPLPEPVPRSDTMADLYLSSGEPVRLFASPLHEGNRVMGMLVLGASLQEGETFVRQILLSLAIALPVMMALSIFGGLFLANRALSPVAAMTMTAQQISAADLGQRIAPPLLDDEIGQLARTFNAMLERLDQGFQRERRLTLDVSHELRTPLAMLKTQLSLAHSRPREAAELLQMMTDMEGDVDRMTRLVEQMLILTRVEQHGLDETAPIDLVHLLETIVGQFQEKALRRGITLNLDLTSQVKLVVNGDAERLRQVFTNLIDNAIKYTDSSGYVQVNISRRWSEILIMIADTGIGIPHEHLPYIFKRFYRVDSARARDTGSFGLGLAITQAIVQAHQGKIEVESLPAQGTTFTVKLPYYGRIDHPTGI